MYLIGGEIGASFLNQSQGKVKQNQNNPRLLLTLNCKLHHTLKVLIIKKITLCCLKGLAAVHIDWYSTCDSLLCASKYRLSDRPDTYGNHEFQRSCGGK